MGAYTAFNAALQSLIEARAGVHYSNVGVNLFIHFVAGTGCSFEAVLVDDHDVPTAVFD